MLILGGHDFSNCSVMFLLVKPDLPANFFSTKVVDFGDGIMVVGKLLKIKELDADKKEGEKEGGISPKPSGEKLRCSVE